MIPQATPPIDPSSSDPINIDGADPELIDEIDEFVPGSSEIVCIESHFPPSRERDCMHDGIVDYLRTRTYPPFLKLTSNRQTARAEFRKKCESFFLDKYGELIEGRAKGLHRHVLRRGELAGVMKFIHEMLGHCNTEVCVKVAQPVVWSSEPFDITAYSVIKRCECRDKNATRRWFPCSVDYVNYIVLMFVREPNGGYLLNLRSISDEVDLSQFQMTVPRNTKPKPKRPEILIDGRYRINDRRELEDVLEKLHLAFGHCSVTHLRILLKSRFHYPTFYMAAREICDRCWFCKLEPHRKHFPISDYGYDIEVKPAKDDSPRKFIIYPRDVTNREVAEYIREILENARKNVDVESAALIANGVEMPPEPTKRASFSNNTSRGTTFSTDPAVATKRLFRFPRNALNNGRSDLQVSPVRPRLIPPYEISLGPTTGLEASDTDSSMSRGSQRCSYRGGTYRNTYVGRHQTNNNRVPRNVASTPLHFEYQTQQQNLNPVIQWNTPLNMTPPIRTESYYVGGEVDEAEYLYEQNGSCVTSLGSDNYVPNVDNQVISFADDTFHEDISEMQPTTSKCVPYIMDYNTNFTSEPTIVTPAIPAKGSVSFNHGSDTSGTLEDLGDLSTFFGDLDAIAAASW